MNRGVWYLAWRHVAYQRFQTAILVVCLAVPIFVPVTSDALIQRYEQALAERAASTPLLAGRKGSRFDLTLAALWFRAAELEPLSMAEVDELDATDGITPLPMRFGFTARDVPVVGVTPEWFELHGLRAAQGSLPVQLGDVVVGAAVAARLGLSTGSRLFSDQRDHYDISKPPALEMQVCGVLPASGGPEDDVVFVALETTWVLDGIMHGHADVDEVDDAMKVGGTERAVALSGAVVEYQRITSENIGAFHSHAEPSALPVSAIVLVPKTAKAATLVKARWNASRGDRQVVVPSEVVGDLMAFVFRIKRLVDGLALVLGACTVLMTVVVVLLSLRLRRRELATLHRIGCRRSTVRWMCGIEIGVILVLAMALAGIGFTGTMLWLPDVLRMV